MELLMKCAEFIQTVQMIILVVFPRNPHLPKIWQGRGEEDISEEAQQRG